MVERATHNCLVIGSNPVRAINFCEKYMKIKLDRMEIKAKNRKLGYYALLKTKIKCKPKYVFVHSKWTLEIDYNERVIYCP